jgi:hypothetical protein
MPYQSNLIRLICVLSMTSCLHCRDFHGVICILNGGKTPSLESRLVQLILYLFLYGSNVIRLLVSGRQPFW